MPTFDNVSIEFEVFCGTCNAGLCGQSDTRHSRQRGQLQVTVEACEKCLEVAREEAREEEQETAQKEIDKLEFRIAELEKELDAALA